MNIKLTLIVVFFVGSISIAQAQTSDAEAEAIVNLLGVQKLEAISKLVPVTGKDSIAFWKIYNEYHQLNKVTAKARLKLYEKTAYAYSKMTPGTADSLSLKYFENRFDQEKTLQDYYKKIKTATNAVIAFEFYQAEIYILTQVRASIMQQIPTYGQLHPVQNKK